MEKFNNIEMTEDELDQVAGGQTYVFLKRKPEGGRSGSSCGRWRGTSPVRCRGTS